MTINESTNACLAEINKSILANSTTESLPQITLADGTKIQTGTVGALMQNIKRYDRLMAGEDVGISKEKLIEMMSIPIPTLKKAGLLDVFPPEEWKLGKSAGRRFVGYKALEMGY